MEEEINILGVGETCLALQHLEWPAMKRTGRITLCLAILNRPYEEHPQLQLFYPQMGWNPPPGASQIGKTKMKGVSLGHNVQIPHQGDCEEVAWSDDKAMPV